MSYEDLMARIAREIPELAGKLSAPRVTYVKSLQKTYITFESGVLAGEKQFLRLEKILRELFPGRPLSVRVVSRGLKESFLDDPAPYRQVLDDFLRRNYPSASGWVGQIGWQIEKNQLSGNNLPAGEEEALLTLVFPSEISLHVMAERNAGARLAQAISDIFGARVRVEMTVAGDREERLRKLQEERRDTVLTVTREEMEKRARAEAEKTAESAGENGGKKPRARKEPKSSKRKSSSMSKNIPHLTNIFKLEKKELKGGEMLLVSFAVTDYTSSILCKAFFRYRSRFLRKGEAAETPITDEERQAVAEKVSQIEVGKNVKLRGECLYDNYAREISITVRDMVETEKEEREDTAPEKRVELHMHTNMSTLDALTPAEDLIARAIRWGHPAVAVTDHGVLQSFPAAFRAAKGKIKLIPGCEGYLIDEKAVTAGADGRPYDGPIVVLDFESTGLNTAKARIIEVGAVKLVEGTVTETFQQLVDPEEALPPKITEIRLPRLQGLPTQIFRDSPKRKRCCRSCWSLSGTRLSPRIMRLSM